MTGIGKLLLFCGVVLIPDSIALSTQPIPTGLVVLGLVFGVVSLAFAALDWWDGCHP